MGQPQIAVLALLLGISLAQLQIMHPVTLRQSIGDNGKMESSLGNFGHINYGTTIIGRIHYPVNNTDGCREFTEKDFTND